MRLRNWLSLLLLLTALVGAQEMVQAKPLNHPNLKWRKFTPVSVTVRVQLAISKDGVVQVLSTEPDLGREFAEQLERGWQWAPATLDGEPVDSVKRVRIDYVRE